MLRFFSSILFMAWVLPVSGQLDTKPLIKDVGVDEHLGQKVDLSLTFTSMTGERVSLADLVRAGKPTVIAPVYYSCPNLCTLVLNGVRDAINGTDLVLGEDYQVLNVSFDPENTPELAAAKAANYYETLDDPKAADGAWRYLTGDKEQIAQLMDEIGFRYKKANGQYSHTSVLVLLSPEGVITRYLYGVRYPSRDFRLAVVEASAGKVGTTIDRLLIYCFRYDPLAGKYVPYAWGIMRAGAALTLIGFLVFGFILWKKELFKKRRLGHHV